MTTIGFVRHGVTDWNLENRAQGQTDVPLNAEGRRQAELLGRRLAAESWDRIFTSDLSRARETAQIIAAYLGKQVDGTDSRLREKSHGRLDGTTLEERVKLWGENWQTIDHGEETLDHVRKRSREILTELTAAYPEERILIVSHGAWIRATLRDVLPDTGSGKLLNTSITVVHLENERWNCTLFNCARHLDIF